MGHRKRSLRLLGSCWLWCQGLLRHHGSPTRVAYSTRMRGLSLGLAGHPDGLLWHVWDRRLSGMGVMLWW